MKLDSIESFYWAATLKGVGNAASKQGIPQSTVSARLRALERELDVDLIDRRDKHHFQLTPAGIRFLAETAPLVERWCDIKEGFKLGTQFPVSLRVGVIESVLHSWLIPWLERLQGERPGLRLELTVETTPTLLEYIKGGRLDVVLAAEPVRSDGVDTCPLPSMPMVFVGKRSLYKERKYSLAQLARQNELLTFQRGSQPHEALLGVLNEAGLLKDARVHAISSISAMERLVAGGFGVATLPHAAVQSLATRNGLKPLLCDTELVPLPIHASWLTDPTSNAIEAIVESAVTFAGGSKPAPRRHRKT